MKKQAKRELLAELEQILEENKRLSQGGGLPKQMGLAVGVVAMYPWQFLALASLVAAGLVFVWSPLDFLKVVRGVLLVG